MATKKDMWFLNEFMPKIYPTQNRTLLFFFDFQPQGWRVGSVSCCHHCAFGSPTATMGRGCSRQHLRIGCGHRTRSSSRGVRKSWWQGFSHVVSVLFLLWILKTRRVWYLASHGSCLEKFVFEVFCCDCQIHLDESKSTSQTISFDFCTSTFLHFTFSCHLEVGVAETLVACMTGEQRSNVNLLKWCAGALELMCAGDWGLLSEKAAEVRDQWFRFWIDGSVAVLPSFCRFFFGEMCNRR